MVRRLVERNINVTVLILVAIQTIVLALIISLLFNLSTMENVVMSWIFTALFAIFCFFLIKDKIIVLERKIPFENKTIEIVERPVYIDRPVIQEIQVPVENKIIEVVDRPVYTERLVYRDKPKTKLHIKKYNYLASTEEKRYHLRKCRLSRIIKKKYKIQNDSAEFFKKRHYVPCKLCIKK